MPTFMSVNNTRPSYPGIGQKIFSHIYFIKFNKSRDITKLQISTTSSKKNYNNFKIQTFQFVLYLCRRTSILKLCLYFVFEWHFE